MAAIEALRNVYQAGWMHRPLPSALRFTTHEENLHVELHQLYLVWWERRCEEGAWRAHHGARYHRSLMRTAFWLMCHLR